MPQYSAYGLTIASELDLQPLLPVETETQADVTLRLGRVSTPQEKSALQVFNEVRVSPESVWLDIPQVAHIRVSRGNEILVEPYPESDPETIRLYVLGSALGSILHQRGFLVLHANAIEVDDKAVLFVGDSGAGKSTTAAIFYQRGFPVLSDDIVAINQNAEILGGFPQIKMWQDALDQLCIANHHLRKVGGESDKYSFPIDSNYVDRSLPISTIYALEPSATCSAPRLETLGGLDIFRYLQEHTYRRELMDAMGKNQSHLVLCEKIADQARIAKVQRPLNGFSGHLIADLVIENLGGISNQQATV